MVGNRGGGRRRNVYPLLLARDARVCISTQLFAVTRNGCAINASVLLIKKKNGAEHFYLDNYSYIRRVVCGDRLTEN